MKRHNMCTVTDKKLGNTEEQSDMKNNGVRKHAGHKCTAGIKPASHNSKFETRLNRQTKKK